MRQNVRHKGRPDAPFYDTHGREALLLLHMLPIVQQVRFAESEIVNFTGRLNRGNVRFKKDFRLTDYYCASSNGLLPLTPIIWQKS